MVAGILLLKESCRCCVTASGSDCLLLLLLLIQPNISCLEKQTEKRKCLEFFFFFKQHVKFLLVTIYASRCRNIHFRFTFKVKLGMEILKPTKKDC